MTTARTRHRLTASVYLVLFFPLFAACQSVVQLYNGFGMVGCFGNGRHITSNYTINNYSNNTVERCIDSCVAQGFLLAGIQNGTECYCSNSITYDGPSNTCNTACPGNPLEICGGPNAVNVYSFNYYVEQDSVTVVEHYGSWNLLGCYANDKPYPPDFTVNYRDTNTVESCLDSCVAQGLPLGGVQNGNECFCGYSITYDGPSYYGCHTPCAGNPLEVCGGYNTINLYEDTYANKAPVVGGYDGWVSLGCWRDSTPRTLHHAVGGSDSNTIAGCVRTCNSLGFSLSGVEYGRECYCGNSILYNYGSSESCNMRCSGNSHETCGGPNAINIYQIQSFPYTVGPASTLQSYKGWRVSTCWDDNAWQWGGPRLLPHGPKVPIPAEQMTVEKCIDGCASSGYTSAGLEWGQECWCGNVTYPPGESTPGACDMPCLGDATEKCGGSSLALLYTSLPIQFLTPGG